MAEGARVAKFQKYNIIPKSTHGTSVLPCKTWIPIPMKHDRPTLAPFVKIVLLVHPYPECTVYEPIASVSLTKKIYRKPPLNQIPDT